MSTKDIFQIEPTWSGRALAAVRVVAFAALFVAANYGVNTAMHGLQKNIPTLTGHLMLAMATIGAAAILLIAIMTTVSSRSFGSYGYTGPHKLRNLFIGSVCGILVVALQLFIENQLGGFSWGTITASPIELVQSGLSLALLFVMVGVAEESLFRGYALVELSRTLSFWPAALVLAALFGLPHWLKGGGETIVGGAEAALFALIMAYSFRSTGSLWFAIGAHTGWDFGQSYIFGVPDSALQIKGSLLHPVIHGPDWLTGGTVGPEGSVVVVISLFLVAAVSRMLRQRGTIASQMKV